MKQIQVYQTANQLIDKFRYFLVNVPDDFDVKSIEDTPWVSQLFDKLANRLGVDWQGDDTLSFEPFHMTGDVEVDDDAREEFPVVIVTKGMLIKAEDEVE